MIEQLPFTKMHGLGNDFIVIDGEHAAAIDDPGALARRFCRRQESVGADGLLIVTQAGNNRVIVRFFNPDGSEAFCGNGSRCAALYSHDRGGVERSMVLETIAGEMPAEVVDDGVRLTLPPAVDLGERLLGVQGKDFLVRLIDSGCPHVVLRQDDVEQFQLETHGPELRSHPELGPDGANVNIFADDPTAVEVDRCRIRTWERGVEGETLACGSGAVACGYVRWLDSRKKRSVFHVRGGGTIEIVIVTKCDTSGDVVCGIQMTGAAAFEFEGCLPLRDG